jgi:carboxypeptidase Taq
MSKKPIPEFPDLKEFASSIKTYTSILSLLHWDQETYMPSGGITARGQQISLLSGHIHEIKTSKKYENLLGRLVHLSSGKPKRKGLSRLEKISLREWHKEYQRDAKLPASFIKIFSQTTSEASQIWQTAKSTNNFKLFAPFLEKILKLNQEKAEILGYGDHPYDALLENYEPSMTSARIKEIFGKLRKELIHLLDQIRSSRPIDDRFLRGSFDSKKQFDLGTALLSQLPIEPDYSRLDLSAHPFSLALHPHDSRITTRILKDGFMSNLFSILHEAGHSMYEMDLPSEHWGTPLAEAVSLGIHESQSRWWETLIGRSLPFWTCYYPIVQQTFPTRLKKIPLNQFYRAINRVTPSFIRVEADEVTYCLHIILRFEIEMALISGQLQVSDLPYAWNDKMKEMLGIVPPTDREGCLQDVHWAFGDFGYFPTYALGNLFAAQFFSAFTKQHSDWEERVKTGELAFVRDFLKTNIHSLGKQYSSENLIKRVTGKPLSETAYCHYLKNKYSQIYGLS